MARNRKKESNTTGRFTALVAKNGAKTSDDKIRRFVINEFLDVNDDMRDLTDTSKYLAKILRHEPEVIGITLDEHGWASADDVVEGIARSRPFDMTTLEELVATDNKQRYSFNGDKTLIRANQGHSIPVDVELEQKTPPDILWHGTGRKFVASIDEQGLIKKSRLYVHLSVDYETAVKVGARHGKVVVYIVHTGDMARDGYDFYQSVNGVWLTDHVPLQYLEKQ